MVNKILAKIFDSFEVYQKRLVKNKAEILSKIKMYFDQERKKYIYDTIKFIVFHGILVNLVLYLFIGTELSIVNTIASGATYYLLTDIVDLFSRTGFILFRGRLK